MNKKHLLAALLLVTNINIFTMDAHDELDLNFNNEQETTFTRNASRGQGWDSDSDDEKSRSPIELKETIQGYVNKNQLISNGLLTSIANEASQFLRSIEENPHSSDALESLMVIEQIQPNLLSLASLKGQSASPIFRDFPTRVNNLRTTIECPSASPTRYSNTNNLDEDINHN
jgi:hypothetical protein